MLYARLRLERAFDDAYRRLEWRWYPAVLVGGSALLRTPGEWVCGPLGDFSLTTVSRAGGFG